MKQYRDQKIAAWHEHGERFDCQHEQTALRKRVVRGGAVQYVHQCQRCGESQRQPLAKAKALRECGGVEPPPFDNALVESWEQRRNESAASINERFSKSAFFAQYDEYLKSSAWARRRQLVLKRAQGTCEGCGERPPVQVHHLTYEHVSNEYLFELVALCDQCHERLHEDESE